MLGIDVGVSENLNPALFHSQLGSVIVIQL